MNNEYQITAKELNSPISQGGSQNKSTNYDNFKCTKSLPNNQFVYGEIKKVKFGHVYRNGKIQYKTDEHKVPILDNSNQPIPRVAFTLNICCRDFKCPSGFDKYPMPLSFGASFHEKANLPKFLNQLGLTYDSDTTSPNDVINLLTNLKLTFTIKLSGENRNNNNLPYENVIWETAQIVSDVDYEKDRPKITELGEKKTTEEIVEDVEVAWED